jgi:hypothetical protein
MADPIVPQTITDVPTVEHQTMLDRLESVLTGAWNAVKSLLPDHEKTDEVLDGIKGAYNTAAEVVKDDLAKTLDAAKQTAESELPGAVAAVEDGAKQVAASVAEAVTPEAADQAPAADVPAQSTSQASESASPAASA